MKNILLFSFLMLLIFACAEENPDLVQPPPQAETVTIRFINLAPDGNSRILDIDGVKSTETMPGRSSISFKPSNDSGYAKILLDGNTEFQPWHKQFFTRNLIYNYVAMSSPQGKTSFLAVDTVQRIASSLAISENSSFAYFKFVNAFNDSTVTYSLRLGCPNGPVLSSAIQYRAQSASKEVRLGKVAVSLVRHEAGSESIIGLYSVELERIKQYVFIVWGTEKGQEKFLFLDQQDNSENALMELDKIDEKTANLRLINLSDKALKIVKKPDEVITEYLQQDFVSEFFEIEACGSTDLDTLIGLDVNTSATLTRVVGSVEALQNYSVLIANSEIEDEKVSISIPPVFLTKSLADSSLVRVVNASSKRESITVSLGARYDKNYKDQNYSSGHLLAANLKKYETSDEVYIQSGPAPITMFTAYSPVQLLFTTVTEFEPGKKYILILDADKDGNDRMTILEDEPGGYSGPAIFLQKGVFAQIVNAVPQLERIEIDYQNSSEGLLKNAVLTYANSLATVMTEGSHIMYINGKPYDIEAKLNERVFLVATGQPDNIQLHSFSTTPMGSDYSNFKRRFINVSTDVSSMTVTEDTSKSPLVIEIPSPGASPVKTELLERRISMYFIDALSEEIKTRIDDISQSYGTNFSFIFSGNADKGYKVIIQQEF